MKLKPEKYRQTCREQNPEEVIAGWLSAVSNVHKQFTQICTYVSQIDLHPKQPKWIGQCPVHQLRALYTIVQDELAQLLQEAKEFGQLTESGNWKKLAKHTARLEQLNQEAQTLLQLASLKAT